MIVASKVNSTRKKTYSLNISERCGEYSKTIIAFNLCDDPFDSRMITQLNIMFFQSAL